MNGFEGEIAKGDAALRIHVVKEGKEHDDCGFAKQRVGDKDGRRVCVGEFGGLRESDEWYGQAAPRWAGTRGGSCQLWRAIDRRVYGSIDGSLMDSVE